MNRYGPLGLYAGLLLVVTYILGDAGSSPHAQAFERLEGSLYHANIPEISKADTPLPRQESYLSHLSVYVNQISALGLPANVNAFIADITSDPGARLKILPNVSDAKSTSSDKPTGRRPKVVPGSPGVAAATQTPGVAAPNPAATAAPVSRESYLTLDAKLSQNPMSFPVANRISRGGITVTLEQLGKFEKVYLLKFSVANNEPDEFFISKVMMISNSYPVSANEFMPFSCRPGEVIYGIVRFSISDVANKRVGFALSESGGKERKYEIRSIDFAF